MMVQVTGDAAKFRELVFPFLQHDPVLNTVLLTNVDSRARGDLVDDDPPTFVSVHDGAAVVGAAMRITPRGIFLGGLAPEYAAVVADALAATAPDAPKVEGLAPTVRAFVLRWRTLLGVPATETGGTRLHLLGELQAATAAGQPRRATEDEVELVIRWVTAFGRELGMPDTALTPVMRGWVDSGRVWLWEHEARPVSLVAHQVPGCGVTRVGPVYTPPELRGRGYASALTGHVSMLLRDGGSRVCLYTELNNPTSNRIYAALGFEPVADFSTYSLA